MRASMFGAPALSLALAAHMAGGGTAPSGFTVLVAAGLAVVPSVLLSRRSRGWVSLLLTLGLVQVALHGLLTVSEAARCVGLSGTAMTDLGHVAVLPGSSTTCMVMSGPHSSMTMLAAHSAAVLATALLLARGEQIALVLWHLLAPRMTMSPPVARRWVSTVVAPCRSVMARRSPSTAVERRRGPPIEFALA